MDASVQEACLSKTGFTTNGSIHIGFITIISRKWVSAGLLLLVQQNFNGWGPAGDTLVLAAVLYTLGSVTIPSLASVYNEMALKKHMDTSVHLQVRPRTEYRCMS